MAAHYHWFNLWLETNSMLVLQAFKNSNLVPWQIRNRWDNVHILLSIMHCIVTHIFREGNQVVDSLANFGFSISMIFGLTIYLCLLENILLRTRLVYLIISFLLLEGVLLWSPPSILYLLSYDIFFLWLLAPLLQPFCLKQNQGKKLISSLF